MVWGIADSVGNLNTKWAVGNSVTEGAWWSMRAGHETIYVTAFVMWCISFIHEPKYQRYFYQSSIWLSLISWLNTFVVNLLFIIGGAMTGGNWSNLVFPIVYDLFTFCWQAIIYFMFYDDLVKYYKWDQQDWWNGEDGEQDMVAIIANDF